MVERLDPLSWSWSSNLTHSLIVDQEGRRAIARRWDRPDDPREMPMPDSRGVARIIEYFDRDSDPIAETVIGKMLRVFWVLRTNIEQRRGTDKDLIRSFNTLLVWADATRRRLVDAGQLGDPSELRDVLPILRNRNLIQFGPDVLSNEAVRSFPIGALSAMIREEDPDTGLVLDPDLFLRHASGVLYEAAHVELTDKPFIRPTQLRLTFDNLSFDSTPPSGEPRSLYPLYAVDFSPDLLQRPFA
ncbi:MAG: hypothetical protein WKF75_04095 [Singulisphaera sp.]